MGKYIIIFFLCMSVLLTAGCSSINPDAPGNTIYSQSTSGTPAITSTEGYTVNSKQSESTEPFGTTGPIRTTGPVGTTTQIVTTEPADTSEIKIVTPVSDWYRIPSDLADVVKRFVQLKMGSVHDDSGTAFEELLRRRELSDIDISQFEGKSLSMKMNTSLPDYKYTCIEVFDDNNASGDKLIFLLIKDSEIWQIDNVFIGSTVYVKSSEECLKEIGSNKLILPSPGFSYISGSLPNTSVSDCKNLIVVLGAWLLCDISFINCENTFIRAINFGESNKTQNISIKECRNFTAYDCTFFGEFIAENSSAVKLTHCRLDCENMSDYAFELKKCNDILFDDISIVHGSSYWNRKIKSIIRLDSCKDTKIKNNTLDSGFKFIDGTASDIVLSGNRINSQNMNTSILFGDWTGNGKIQKLIINNIGNTDKLMTFYKEDGASELVQLYIIGSNYAVHSFINDVNGDGRDEIIYPDLGEMISLNGSAAITEPVSKSKIKSEIHEWKVDLDNDGIEETVKETLSVDISKEESISLDIEILQDGQTQSKKQFQPDCSTKNLIAPGIAFDDIDSDGIKEVLIENKMILKPVKENGSWSELRNIESDISFRANDYVRITSIDKEKNEVILDYRADPERNETITVPVPLGIMSSEKLRISEAGGFYTNDIDQDGVNELFVRSYLEIPYLRHSGLEDDGIDAICYYGQIASIDIYVNMNDNHQWSIKQIIITPKYDSSAYDKYWKGDFRGLFNELRGNPQPYSVSGELSGLSNQINYYGSDFWIPNYDITTPQLILNNGLAVGFTKDEVIKIMGIPDVGNAEDNQWSYYCVYSGPEYQTMNIYFHDDRVKKIELRCEMIFA